SLAATPDGATVYAAVFFSGSQTTTAGCFSGDLPPSPPMNPALPPPPGTGLIVRWDGTNWVDELGHNQSFCAGLTVPDEHVFAIDANAEPPVEKAAIPHVGTVLFNLAVNPSNGKVYVSNTEARNAVRFEPNIHGHVTENRITVIDGTSVTPRHLNPHID